MNKLISLDQLKVGTYLKIIGRNERRDSHEKVSVKKLIPMMKYTDETRTTTFLSDTEVLISKKNNYYFSLGLYLEGKSSWAKEIYVLPDPLDEVAIALDSVVGKVLRSVRGYLEEMPCNCDHGYDYDYDDDDEEEKDCLRCVALEEIESIKNDPEVKES